MPSGPALAVFSALRIIGACSPAPRQGPAGPPAAARGADPLPGGGPHERCARIAACRCAPSRGWHARDRGDARGLEAVDLVARRGLNGEAFVLRHPRPGGGKACSGSACEKSSDQSRQTTPAPRHLEILGVSAGPERSGWALLRDWAGGGL